MLIILKDRTIHILKATLLALLLMMPLGVVCAAGNEETDTTKWYNKTYDLDGVTVKGRKSRYSRKNNPAVELMKKVVAAKKRNRLEERDFYRFDRYQKITLAANELTIGDIQDGMMSRIPGVLNQIEACPMNNKLILPIMVSETASEKIYRKSPKRERTIVKGERSSGITDMFSSGEVMTAAMRDFFSDVDIYEDNIRLFQNRFTSPVSDAAINFYRFYITDTLEVAGDSCIQLRFFPNNRRDFGFMGEIYIIKDSSYQVKRCALKLPNISSVNFVEGLFIMQEFSKLSDGSWQLTTDDMLVELKLFDFLNKAVVMRTTRLSGHDFSPIDEHRFTEGNDYDQRRAARKRDEDFWKDHRQVEMSKGEARMDDFIAEVENDKVMKFFKPILRIFIENHIETSAMKGESKFDIGPVNTFISSNEEDGWRARLGGKTTANLHPQLFANGYWAYGFGSKNHYYKAEATYSFNKKDYLPNEFPRRNITFMSTNDVGTPMDKFMTSDKDNVFTSLKWAEAENMTFYNRQKLTFEREEKWNFRTTLTLTAEKTSAAGEMVFLKMDGRKTHLRTTEARIELRWAPGEDFVDTRSHRRQINHDAPIFTLSHTTGFDGVLGGQYKYNHTEFSFFKRVWFNRWGHIDVNAGAGAQWNQVPFPLLCMPAANLSYILQRGTFNLVNNMEFLNDRYASLSVEWNLNGKIFNRIPLFNRLKWREYIGVKTLWGTLSDKNNPLLAANQGSDILMQFPTGSHVMDKDEPYVEVMFGVHNVFRFFHIEYVRRLNYLNLPTAHEHGIRLMFDAQF